MPLHWSDSALSLHLGNLGLQNCTSMVGLDLSSNNFSGSIPSDISRQVPYLTSLNLSNNSFSGEIPVSVTDMAYLNVLNLQHNQLSGGLPARFSNLARLTSLNVADNLLSGSIPYSLVKFRASSFAGNQGLCGVPLDYHCSSRRKWRPIRFRLHRINDESSIGAAVGFVVGFVVAFYFPRCFLCSRKLRPHVFRKC